MCELNNPSVNFQCWGTLRNLALSSSSRSTHDRRTHSSFLLTTKPLVAHTRIPSLNSKSGRSWTLKLTWVKSIDLVQVRLMPLDHFSMRWTDYKLNTSYLTSHYGDLGPLRSRIHRIITLLKIELVYYRARPSRPDCTGRCQVDWVLVCGEYLSLMVSSRQGLPLPPQVIGVLAHTFRRL